MKPPTTAAEVYQAEEWIETDPDLLEQAAALAVRAAAAGLSVATEATPASLVPVTLSGRHAGLLVSLQLDVDAATQLAWPGGEAPEDLHITLCYCQDVAELGERGLQRAIEVVTSIAKTQTTLTGRVGGIGRFHASDTSDGQDVVFAIADVPGLTAFREQLATALRAQGIVPRDDHGFIPHITLAFLSPGVVADVEALLGPIEVPELALTFSDVVVTADEALYVVPFGATESPSTT